jgi:hypothetical protein
MSQSDAPCRIVHLTYISIQDDIKYWMDRGRLFQVFPRLPGSPVNRVLLVGEEVNQLIVGPWASENEEIRAGRLWADFDRYIEGRLISVALNNPYRKPNTTYMARLDPARDDVIEIRSRDPKPGIRVFGRFADKDVYIALNWEHREKLGGPQDKEFDREREICKAKWRQLFPTHPSVNGNQLNEYFADTSSIIPV